MDISATPITEDVPPNALAHGRNLVAGLNLDARAEVAVETPPVAPATFSTFEPPLETYGTSVVVYDEQGVDVPEIGRAHV